MDVWTTQPEHLVGLSRELTSEEGEKKSMIGLVGLPVMHCPLGQSPSVKKENLERSSEDLQRTTHHLESMDDMRGSSRGGSLDSVDYSPTYSRLEMGYREDSLRRGISSYESASSPDSPDRHFCSSTTTSHGDLHGHLHGDLHGHLKTSLPDDKEGDGPKRLCLVCGDTASGFHYGVASCEACKAFFKRTIQGNIEYTCPATTDCEINKRRRKACQACRFQKCLRMGMLKEGVRLDRVRGGRQKYRRNSELPYPPTQALPAKKPTLEENRILVALLGNEPDLPSGLCPEALVTHGTISILSDIYDKEIISTIGWAKQVPGFTDLTLNDQMRLLQSTWSEVLTLSIAYRSLSTPGRLTFTTDFSLDEKTAKDAGALELFQPCLQVLERFERLGILKEEFCLLKALVLVNADTRIDDFGSLRKLRETMLNALLDCSTVLRSGNAVSHVNMLLLCLPLLRQADLAIKKFWLSVRREGKVLMNKLFVEMLEAYFR